MLTKYVVTKCQEKREIINNKTTNWKIIWKIQQIS